DGCRKGEWRRVGFGVGVARRQGRSAFRYQGSGRRAQCRGGGGRSSSVRCRHRWREGQSIPPRDRQSVMLIELRNVERSFHRAGEAIPGLRTPSLTIRPGEFVAILGPSGSGKSTLMNVIGLLDRPTAGALLFDGTDCATLSRNQLAQIRNRRIGLVFQAYHLLPRQDVTSNVEL